MKNTETNTKEREKKTIATKERKEKEVSFNEHRNLEAHSETHSVQTSFPSPHQPFVFINASKKLHKQKRKNIQRHVISPFSWRKGPPARKGTSSAGARGSSESSKLKILILPHK